MAVVVWLVAAALLIISALFEQDQQTVLQRVLAVLAQWTAGGAFVLAAIYSTRKRLKEWIEHYLIDLAGPALIRSMPPRAVLGSLLPRIYGDRIDHQEILTGILGGAGRDASGGDTAVSRETTVHLEIDSVNDTECISYLTWTHEYSGVRNNHLFVIFVTSDPEIANLVASDRIFPLYELWAVAEEDELEDFVPSLRENLRAGIRYLDVTGNSYTVLPRPHPGEEVAFRHYDHFVRLPEHVDRKNLRIVQLDLHDLADDDHVVEKVETLTVRVSNVAAFNLGYLVWSPPHPCFVRTISFDLSRLARADENLVYLVVLATIERARMPTNRWTPLVASIEVPVDSWMLPGHNVTLLYRPTTAELPGASELD